MARKLSLDKGKVAPYFKGDWNSSTIGREAFSKANGDTAITEEVEYQYSGELGAFLLMNKVGVRLGLLLVYPQILDNVEGRDASGVTMYNLDSRIYGVFGVVHFEYSPVLDAGKRWYFSVGGGMGTVTVQNSYTFTPASTFGLIDFTEELIAYVPVYEASTGFEFLLMDNVTMFGDLGYRHLLATGFKHVRDFNGFNGQVTKGSEAKNTDNQQREIQMHAVFAGIGFKFYIQ